MTGPQAAAGSTTGEQPVPTYIADYQVQRALGSGNTGRVYLARPPRRMGMSEEFVAVKVFNGPCLDPAYDRAVEELRVVSELKSTYLARVFETGLDGSSFYYAMEYAVLGSLAAPGRPLSQSEVLLAVSHAPPARHTYSTKRGSPTPRSNRTTCSSGRAVRSCPTSGSAAISAPD